MRTLEEQYELLESLLDIARKGGENGELDWLEFKTNIAEQKASITYEGVGEYISGMANSACIRYKDYAYLVLGVEDATWKCGISEVVSACCDDIAACLFLAD